MPRLNLAERHCFLVSSFNPLGILNRALVVNIKDHINATGEYSLP